MMNKQEAIEKIKNITAHETFMSERIWVKYDEVIDIVNQIYEPEKPVLSKEEAEWLEHLKSIGNFTHCLYVITRQGWGCDFEFRSHGKKYKLSCASENDGDENELTKNRLVNALIYGYEVEKEKLYTVELPNPNGDGYSKLYLSKNKDGKVELFQWSDYTSIDFADDWKLLKNAQLTEDEIKQDFAWAWEFVEEVEE